jgi:hypothetical protein
MSFAKMAAAVAAAVAAAAVTGVVDARGNMRRPAPHTRAPSTPAPHTLTHARPPSRAAQRAALRQAERSRYLWATVNVCEPARRVVGIRGQIPALGFSTRMRMIVRFGYYPRPGSRLHLIHDASLALGVGTHASGLYQRGAEFTFTAARPVTISGSITFEWFLARRLLGSTTRAARGRVRNVQDSRPRGESAARCRIR